MVGSWSWSEISDWSLNLWVRWDEGGWRRWRKWDKGGLVCTFKAEVPKGEGRKYLETFEGSLIVIGGCVSTFQLNVAALFRADCCATCKGVLAESWPSILGFSQYNFYWFGSDSLIYRNPVDFLQIGKTVLLKFLWNLLCFKSNTLNSKLSK